MFFALFWYFRILSDSNLHNFTLFTRMSLAALIFEHNVNSMPDIAGDLKEPNFNFYCAAERVRVQVVKHFMFFAIVRDWNIIRFSFQLGMQIALNEHYTATPCEWSHQSRTLFYLPYLFWEQLSINSSDKLNESKSSIVIKKPNSSFSNAPENIHNYVVLYLETATRTLSEQHMS